MIITLFLGRKRKRTNKMINDNLICNLKIIASLQMFTYLKQKHAKNFSIISDRNIMHYFRNCSVMLALHGITFITIIN